MKWNQIFNRGKRAEQAAAGSLHSLLLPSLLGISVCLLTLCSLTWAWFTAQVHTDTTTIQSAYIKVYAASSADAFVPAGAATQDAESDAVMMAYAVPVNPEPSTVETEDGDGTENKPVYVPTELGNNSGKFYFVAQGTAQKAYLKITVGEGDNAINYYTKPLHPTDPDAKDDNGNVITPVSYTVYEVNLGSEISGNITLSLCWGDNTNVSNLIEPTPVKDGESNKTITTWPGDGGAAKIMTSLWITEEEEETEQKPIVSEEKEPEQMTEEKKEETKTEEKKPQENEQEEPKQEEKPKVETQDGISDDNQSDKESESNVPGGTGSIT